MIIDIIERSKEELIKQGLEPKWIKMSPASHQILLDEVYRLSGKKHTRIFEYMGLRIDIEDECPSHGAYMGGGE